MKIKKLWIAREKFNNILHIKNKLSYHKWIEYIDNHQDYFVWYEDTEDGIHIKNNIDKVPDDFIGKTLLSLNKRKALAEFNNKKGYYEVVIGFNDELGTISTTFMKRIKKEHLRRLLDLANYPDALLLNNGTKIMDEKVIEGL